MRFDTLLGAEAVEAASVESLGCFERPAWVEAVAAARGRPHRFVAVRASQAAVPDAWLFGGVHRRAGVPVFESMPMTGYGGWRCASDLSGAEECSLNRAWLRRSGWPLVLLTCRPGRSDALPQQTLPRFIPARWRRQLSPLQLSTHVLDLTGDDATLLQRARPRMRGYLRQAGRADFDFERRTGRQAMSRLYHWYVRGSQAWRQQDTTPLPEGFFAALADDPGAETWTVSHRGREVGSALFLLGRTEVQYQASGTERIDAPLTAMESVLWHAARHYRDRGYATLNLGASAGLDSVARFKEKFGATERVYERRSYLLPAVMDALP